MGKRIVYWLLGPYVSMSLSAWLASWTNSPLSPYAVQQYISGQPVWQPLTSRTTQYDWPFARAWIRIFRWAKLKLSNAQHADMPVISYAPTHEYHPSILSGHPTNQGTCGDISLELQPVIQDVADLERETSQTVGYIPKWITLPIAEVACLERIACQCAISYVGNCKCFKADVECTSLCKSGDSFNK